VLQAETAAPAIVVGHSLGGPIAARLAVDSPTEVSALVLLAPSIDPAQERHRWFNIAGSLRVVQWFLAVDWTTSNREIWPLRGELTRLGARLAEVSCPVVTLQGTKDSLVPPENSEYCRRTFTGAPVEVRWIPGADHFIPWSHAGIVRTAILGLLDRQPHHSGGG
jgi:pimeloyl-ACP methyl ester carboxylesterase